ncbi:hypothetical protein AAG570_009938 [Ranatra chinensis]|uniref:Cytochrome P450 n=1 Tax=Ranatra chinensis TaxID=642074 RepID=A0ABD0YQJ8_9HEMI
MSELVWLGGVALALLAATWLWRSVRTWKDLGLCEEAAWPLLGSDPAYLLALKPRVQFYREVYRRNRDLGRSYVGVHTANLPSLVLLDPQLVEEVAVKLFSQFPGRSNIFPEDIRKLDPLMDNIVFACGEKWKRLRGGLTTAFSGAKLKGMEAELVECGRALQRKVTSFAREGRPVEVTDLVRVFAIDVIAACGFGVRVDATSGNDSQFARMACRAAAPSFKRKTWAALRTLFPPLTDIFRISFLESEVQRFFLKVATDTVNIRESETRDKVDFLQLLLNIKRNDGGFILLNFINTSMDDNDIAANLFIFFIAGFETTSSAISFCLYELSLNPYVQERLRREVIDALGAQLQNINYESLKGISYLNQVIAETLRMYPTVPMFSRKSSKPCKIPGIDALLPAGCRVDIPIHAIHYDPQYYPEPDRFDPDRFEGSNPKNVPKGAYIPFGYGPRKCIGDYYDYTI